jgi:hypothetical protein
VALPGRPPKPIEVKRRTGNPGKRKLPKPIIALEPVRSAAQVGEHADGRAWLQAVLDAGASTWIGPTDEAMLRLAMELWDDRQVARQAWLAEPTNDVLRKSYEGLTARLTSVLSALGLDPVSRSRLGVAAVKARTKLEELRARSG